MEDKIISSHNTVNLYNFICCTMKHNSITEYIICDLKAAVVLAFLQHDMALFCKMRVSLL